MGILGMLLGKLVLAMTAILILSMGFFMASIFGMLEANLSCLPEAEDVESRRGRLA